MCSKSEERKVYTQDANEFIGELEAEGYERGDIFTKYVTGGKRVVYPVIGEDGRAHLASRTFRDTPEVKKEKAKEAMARHHGSVI